MKILLGIFSFLFIFSLTETLKSQSITWQRTYGGSNIDYGYSIVQTPDQGYVAVGRKRAGIYNYMFAMRLNAYGDTIWTKLYKGGSAYEIEKLADGNFVINGPSLFKIDINGNRIWRQNFQVDLLNLLLTPGFI